MQILKFLGPGKKILWSKLVWTHGPPTPSRHRPNFLLQKADVSCMLTANIRALFDHFLVSAKGSSINNVGYDRGGGLDILMSIVNQKGPQKKVGVKNSKNCPRD